MFLFLLHRDVCPYATASSLGGNADVACTYPISNDPVCNSDDPLFPGETELQRRKWFIDQGGRRNQEVAVACRNAHHALRLYSEGGGGDEAVLRQLEVAALEAGDALNTAKYTGPKNMLRTGISLAEEAMHYQWSHLEKSILFTFKVDGGGAETTVLAKAVLKDPGQRVVICGEEGSASCGYVSPGSIVVSYTRPGPGTPRVHMSLRKKPLGDILYVPGVSNPDEQLTHVTVTGAIFYKPTSTSRKKWSQQMTTKVLKPYQPPSLPLLGQAQALPWYVYLNIFRAEFTTYLQGPSSAGGVQDPPIYLTFYNYAMHALIAELQSRAASLPFHAPCPWNLQTAAGLHEALEETKVLDKMLQKYGKGWKSKVNKFMKWLEKKAAEEDGSAKKKQKTLSFKKT